MTTTSTEKSQASRQWLWELHHLSLINSKPPFHLELRWDGFFLEKMKLLLDI